jgi:hypothetical protein
MSEEQTGKSKLYAGLIKARRNFADFKRAGQNEFIGNKYATLGAVIDAVKDPLLDEGIFWIQSVTEKHFEVTGDKVSGWVVIQTKIFHESGEEDISYYPMAISPHKKANSAQSVGLATTYGKRYALVSALGLADEDRDGNTGDDDKEQNNNQGNQNQSNKNTNQNQQPKLTPEAIKAQAWLADTQKALKEESGINIEKLKEAKFTFDSKAYQDEANRVRALITTRATSLNEKVSKMPEAFGEIDLVVWADLFRKKDFIGCLAYAIKHKIKVTK